MVDRVAPFEEKPLVLVADDDDMQQFLMRETLEAEGFAVKVVGDGAAALEAVSTHRPDVVILDVVMPVMDGYAACAALRARPDSVQLPIVMVTGQEDLDSIKRAYDAGATDFIAKPLNWTLLRHRMRYVYRAGATVKQLRASEARLAEAQRIARLGSWAWVVGSDHVDCSAEVVNIFGLPEIDGPLRLTSLLERIHPEDRGGFEARLRRLGADLTSLTTELRILPDDGAERFVEVNARAEIDAPGGSITAKGAFQDVTERRHAEARLDHLAHYDTLTGLPNRLLFQDRLKQALARARRDGTDAAVFCFDVDRFKDINDSLGHGAGDRLLHDIATRMQNEIRGTDTVARLGGDEFAIVQVGLMQPGGAESLSNRLLRAFSEPFEVDGQQIYASASIGVAIGPHDADDPEQLMIKADMALHRAKSEGRGVCHFFEDGMDIAFRARKQVEQDLRRALSEGWFELHYQPQISVDVGTIVGAEALLRLRHPDQGLMMPDRFISIAEETGLIVPIGAWVLHATCQQAAAWRKAGLPEIRVAVNLSPTQFRQAGLVDTVADALEKADLEPHQLEVEITESVLIRDTAAVTESLQKLRQMGVKIAMDDFGTGYSSLSYLQRFPFDRIKIDRSFVKDMTENPDAAAIVGAVVALGRSLNMSTTAEGVETLTQLNYLREKACNEVQGYYFGRPMPAEALEGILREGITFGDSGHVTKTVTVC